MTRPIIINKTTGLELDITDVLYILKLPLDSSNCYKPWEIDDVRRDGDCAESLFALYDDSQFWPKAGTLWIPVKMENVVLDRLGRIIQSEN